MYLSHNDSYFGHSQAVYAEEPFASSISWYLQDNQHTVSECVIVYYGKTGLFLQCDGDGMCTWVHKICLIFIVWLLITVHSSAVTVAMH